MKKTLISVVFLSAILVLISITNIPTTFVAYQVMATSTPETVKDILTPEQRAYLGALEWCESRGKPGAINPKDSDGTPSFGILQFKPSSYAYFESRYDLATTTSYMDKDGQEAIVEQMMIRNDVTWTHQFPGCVHKLGTPPQS